jgi:hypothetical protein
VPMARLRKVAMALGAAPVWMVEPSSAKVTSLTWCKASTPQSPGSRRPGRPGGRRGW